MAELKYKVIATGKQYDKYCKILTELVATLPKTIAIKEEIDLLTLLIEKYEEEYNIFGYADPVHLLHSLLKEHNMKK